MISLTEIAKQNKLLGYPTDGKLSRGIGKTQFHGRFLFRCSPGNLSRFQAGSGSVGADKSINRPLCPSAH